jgi:hypothetical protein
MQQLRTKTHSDGIWISDSREKEIVKAFSQQLAANGFEPIVQCSNNFGYPYIYQRQHQRLNCRVVDSVFFTDPETWTNPNSIIITDNHPTQSIAGQLLTVLPEFWSIWHFEPKYIDRPATMGFNCFMNRPRGDRSVTFYELIKRDLLEQGIVSYNCTPQQYQQEFIQAELQRYNDQHIVGQTMIPYNTVESHGTLEQCIIDSNISLILETYTSDNHIVFSEKIFRALQLPRPWLLYCSPGSVALLKDHGFDVLDDIVNIAYDEIKEHGARLLSIIDQLETFVDQQYTDKEYKRFGQAAEHNQQLLLKFASQWPEKFNNVLETIKKL